MDLSTLNWFAIVAATAASFVIGGLWYSPILFGKVWMLENKFTEEELKKANQGKIFGLTFIFSFIMSVNLALFLNDSATTATWGATAGFLAGFGWVAMAIFVNGLFERRTMRYMLINAGYFVVSFVIIGLILGAWR
ncbi:MAG: DUF1761 domain-containing protein [Candidatus Cyclobacteriaceae bacterium M2_1C_046]